MKTLPYVLPHKLAGPVAQGVEVAAGDLAAQRLSALVNLSHVITQERATGNAKKR